MISLIRSLTRVARRFARKEDGNSTIEFVMLFPLTIMISFMSYETGMLSMRQVMLERGLDVVVRSIRIGGIKEPDHFKLKKAICDEAGVIPDCMNQIRLEMITNDLRNWSAVSTRANCVDRAEEAEPLIDIPTGGNNQLMILRVCALFDPFMPGSAIGQALPKESGGAYALTATTSFVMEPFQ